MKKLKIMIATEDGTVLDSAEIELEQWIIDLPQRLADEIQAEVGDGINWNRISNILGSEV